MRNIETVCSATPLQAGFIFHTVYGDGDGAYIAQLSFRLRGEVDGVALRESWRRMIERHSALRTIFVWRREAEPVQVVYRQVGLPWEQEDWRGLSAIEQEEQLQGLLQADRRRGFELKRAPLLRLYLIRLDEESYRFIFSCHHLVLDGWSFAVVLKEVFDCYQALCRGERLRLPAVRPFGDYIAWLQGRDGSGARQYWQERLKGFRMPTALRVERARAGTADQAAAYAEQRISIPPSASQGLASLGRRERLTLNTLVQGGWALLLSRYSGEDDVVFGTTVSGRPAELAGVETMVGLFINTLPHRVRVRDDARLLSWLQELQTQQLERQPYEYSRLVDVQGWSEVPRGQALFESLLVVENYPVDASLQGQPLAAVQIEDVRFREQTNYPLTLVVVPGAGLTLRLMYDAHRYEEATVRRLLGHLQGLLETIGTGADRRLGDVSLLTAAEQRELLVDWNRHAPRHRRDRGIHEKFEEQAASRPDAIAVVCEGQQLTYEQLNRRANQLAHHLRGAGVGREVAVGIFMERTLEMVVAILGVLKAGGTYVPLDPAYPAARLGLMLADVQARVIVAEAALAPRLPEHAAAVVVLDAERELIARQSETGPAHRSWADDLAYVIYTSGSTGKPKGVMVTPRQCGASSGGDRELVRFR